MSLNLALGLALWPVLTICAAAQSISGRVIDQARAPVTGILVEIDSGAFSATTSDTGHFSFPAVSTGLRQIAFLPPPGAAAGGLLAPRQLAIEVVGNMFLGNIVLAPGASVSGSVIDPTGAPVAGANIDATDAAGATLFTPNDGTNAAGLFSIVVPFGLTLLEVLPPTSSTLVARGFTVNIQGTLNVGTIELPQGYPVTGTVVDALSGLPVANAQLTTLDNITDFEIPQLAPATNGFGVFSMLLPIGVFHIETEPPTGSLHVGHETFGLFVLGPTNIGAIQLDPAIQVTGTVIGPNGPVANCDVDAVTLDGYKIFTPNDNTNLSGTFTLSLPAGSYEFEVDPPVEAGLIGARTTAFTFAASGNVGTISLAFGTPLVISVVGPNGPEAFADLDLTNSTTGEEIVLVGDHADHLGIIRTYVPTDTFDIAVDAPQGSVAESFHQSNGVISGPLNIALSLGMKTLRLDASSLGTMTIQPNGTLAVNLTVQNMTATTVPATMQVVVRLPSGVEIAVFPTLAIDFIPNQSLTIPAALVPIPNVPATQFGREIRLLFRARSRASGQVLDQASVKFVIE